ncbi:MAG: UDP diphosphate synthase [Theionarchaea archaeon DG-70-1]|nr:MAG: UDP diphosphate synthase [Theionarchaea archaeon DG-70-1]
MHVKSFLYSHIPSFLLRPLYRLYEGYLIDEIKKGEIPRHIGIIMDGNRRFAKETGILTWEAHWKGANRLEEILDWCNEIAIKEVTVYAFSTENFSRSQDEVNHLMDLFEKKFYDIAQDERIHRNKTRVRALGKLESLPEKVRKAIQTAEESTKGHNNQYFNVCIAYGGRSEIIEAFKKVAQKMNLIIRTGGEVRLSNFLLFQAAYAELFFCDIYFPAFRKVDFLRIIREFQKRKRRLGA